jgi:hypothetical protein
MPAKEVTGTARIMIRNPIKMALFISSPPFLVSSALKVTSANKPSHPLSKLAPPHTATAKALLYLSIPIKGMELLALWNNRDELMTENSSGTVESSF